jgi:hypothetical protein
MPDLNDPWDEMIHLLGRLNFDHLDALDADPATIATLAEREPEKAAWLLYALMHALTLMAGTHRRLSAYPDVVARVKIDSILSTLRLNGQAPSRPALAAASSRRFPSRARPAARD